MLDKKETFGMLVRRLRKSKDLTQSKLAGEIGVDESYISKIEADKLSYTPSEETIRLIAEKLEADPLQMLSLAKKAPEELKGAADSETAREFFSLLRNSQIDHDDWQDLTDTLRHRLTRRGGK
jgi:transcriptional regulator with XRE-family HTH domain